MEILKELQQRAQPARLDWIVIGGLAVNFYGYSRETADLDLLVCRDDRETWLQLLGSLGYSKIHDGDSFLQFARGEADWPVDLMLTPQPTFRRFIEHARSVPIFDVDALIPALEHLICLKLHSLKHARAHRFLKDFQDVEGLLRVNHLDPASEKIRIMFEKYATLELHQKMVNACANE